LAHPWFIGPEAGEYMSPGPVHKRNRARPAGAAVYAALTLGPLSLYAGTEERCLRLCRVGIRP